MPGRRAPAGAQSVPQTRGRRPAQGLQEAGAGRGARLLGLAATVGTIGLLAAGCGSSGSGGSSGPSGQAAAITHRPPRLLAVLSSAGKVTITNANGQPVTSLPSGRYTVSITVESAKGDFHLSGPQIGRRTRRHFTGVVLWGVNFQKGSYTYRNDYDHSPAAVHVITVD